MKDALRSLSLQKKRVGCESMAVGGKYKKGVRVNGLQKPLNLLQLLAFILFPVFFGSFLGLTIHFLPSIARCPTHYIVLLFCSKHPDEFVMIIIMCLRCRGNYFLAFAVYHQPCFPPVALGLC